MAKVKAAGSSSTSRPMRPAITPEARENQLISLATDLVEKRLREGTASSQETTHFLKLATQKSRLENQLLEAQTRMAMAKEEALRSQRRSDEMFEKAINAFRMYSGQGGDDDEEYEDRFNY